MMYGVDVAAAAKFRTRAMHEVVVADGAGRRRFSQQRGAAFDLRASAERVEGPTKFVCGRSDRVFQSNMRWPFPAGYP